MDYSRGTLAQKRGVKAQLMCTSRIRSGSQRSLGFIAARAKMLLTKFGHTEKILVACSRVD